MINFPSWVSISYKRHDFTWDITFHKKGNFPGFFFFFIIFNWFTSNIFQVTEINRESLDTYHPQRWHCYMWNKCFQTVDDSESRSRPAPFSHNALFRRMASHTWHRQNAPRAMLSLEHGQLSLLLDAWMNHYTF